MTKALTIDLDNCLAAASDVGELFCEHRGERVGIGGHAVTYSSGFLHVT